MRLVFQSRMNAWPAPALKNARSTIPSRHRDLSISQTKGISECAIDSLWRMRFEKSGSFFAYCRNNFHSFADRVATGDLVWCCSKTPFHELSSCHESLCMRSCHQRPYKVAGVSVADRVTTIEDASS